MHGKVELQMVKDGREIVKMKNKMPENPIKTKNKCRHEGKSWNQSVYQLKGTIYEKQKKQQEELNIKGRIEENAL